MSTAEVERWREYGRLVYDAGATFETYDGEEDAPEDAEEDAEEDAAE